MKAKILGLRSSQNVASLSAAALTTPIRDGFVAWLPTVTARGPAHNVSMQTEATLSRLWAQLKPCTTVHWSADAGGGGHPGGHRPVKAEQAVPAAAPQVGEPQRSANPDLRAISSLARHGARPEEEWGGGGAAAEPAASPTREQLSSARGSVSRNYSHPAGGHYCQIWAQY